MTPPARAALALAFGLLLSLLGSLGCDRAEKRAAEEQALRDRPPVKGGSVTEAMARERVASRLPTVEEQLMLAIREGDRSKVERQLSEGARLDSHAPLLVTAVRGEGDLSFIEWLMELGVGIDVPDAAGRTPLSWAAGRGSLEIVSHLLERGASVEPVDQLGRSPLHYAVFGGNDLVVERLLDANVSPNVQDSLGTTPLMYACSKNLPNIVRTLRARGADPTIEDRLGRTAARRAHGVDNPCAK